MLCLVKGVSLSQLSVSQPVHVLDVRRQLVVDHLVPAPVVPALRLQGEQLEEKREGGRHEADISQSYGSNSVSAGRLGEDELLKLKLRKRKRGDLRTCSTSTSELYRHWKREELQ